MTSSNQDEKKVASTDKILKESDSNTVIDAPGSLGDVMQTLQVTLLNIWKNFLEHTPYLVAGFLALILTWAITHLFSSMGTASSIFVEFEDP